MGTSLDGPHQPPLSCGKPAYIVVLLHGAGSNGDEVIELALDWAPTLNKAEFLAPHAPWLGEADGDGRQWVCPTSGVQPPGAAMDEAVERLHAFLDAALAKRRLDDSQLALVGFAQGAALALYAGLRRAKAPGAIVAVAGSVDEGDVEPGNLRSRPPVLLVDADIQPRPDPGALAKTEQLLSHWGVSVQRLVNPGSYHGLDDEGVSLVASYLRQALVKPSGD